MTEERPRRPHRYAISQRAPRPRASLRRRNPNRTILLFRSDKANTGKCLLLIPCLRNSAQVALPFCDRDFYLRRGLRSDKYPPNAPAIESISSVCSSARGARRETEDRRYRYRLAVASVSVDSNGISSIRCSQKVLHPIERFCAGVTRAARHPTRIFVVTFAFRFCAARSSARPTEHGLALLGTRFGKHPHCWKGFKRLYGFYISYPVWPTVSPFLVRPLTRTFHRRTEIPRNLLNVLRRRCWKLLVSP